MNLIGLIMAGGKGKRMEVDGEKPLIPLANKPMIKHVIDALREVEDIEKIIVGTSPHTPKTTKYISSLSIETVKTNGKGYHPDLKEAIKKIGNETTLIISADLPLIKPTTLKNIIIKFYKSDKPSLSVFVEQASADKDWNPEDEFKVKGRKVYPAGINIIEGRKINLDKIEQENIILSEPELAINVNSEEKLKIAEKELQKKEG